jgi:hypothetical protein
MRLAFMLFAEATGFKFVAAGELALHARLHAVHLGSGPRLLAAILFRFRGQGRGHGWYRPDSLFLIVTVV